MSFNHLHNTGNNICATDLDENRLRVAKEMGATYTVKVTTRDSRELAKQIVDTLGCSPDRTIECSGAAPSIATAIYVSTVMINLAGYSSIFGLFLAYHCCIIPYSLKISRDKILAVLPISAHNLFINKIFML